MSYILQDKNTVFIGLLTHDEKGVLLNVRGSGVLINNSRVVTCDHVLKTIPQDRYGDLICGIQAPNSDPISYGLYPIEVLPEKRNERRDVAIVKLKQTLSDLGLSGYGVSSSEFMSREEIKSVSIGTQLYFLGFPLANELLKMKLGVTMVVSSCILASKKYQQDDGSIHVLLVDKFISPGSSGSPVMTGDGKIIGIASGVINNTYKLGETLINVPVNLGFVRSADHILELLN